MGDRHHDGHHHHPGEGGDMRPHSPTGQGRVEDVKGAGAPRDDDESSNAFSRFKKMAGTGAPGQDDSEGNGAMSRAVKKMAGEGGGATEDSKKDDV